MNEPLERMLDTIRAYGMTNEHILDAMRNVPREYFVPEKHRAFAYDDNPMVIGHSQSISQPYTVAMMLDALELEKGLKVLEIGSGSGWNAALLQELVGGTQVMSVEYIKELAELARDNLKKIGSFAKVMHGDGSLGYKAHAPYDRIIVTCASPSILDSWKQQLMLNGIIIAPVGYDIQNMVKYHRDREITLGEFRFVRLRGEFGYN